MKYRCFASFLLLGVLNAVLVSADEANQQEPAVFDVLELQVDGNTLLPQEIVEKTLYPFLGEAKRVEDVEQARLKLEAEYRSHGYPTVIVEIPEQEVLNGVVLLNVVEGSVDSIKVTGAQYFLPSKIREQVPELSVGKTPYMPKVQEQLAELGKQASDRQVTPVFRAGSTPGKTEVELKVKDQLPLHGSLEMNGRNSEHTSRSRLIGSVRYDNLWQRFHSASLQYQVSPEDNDEVEVWSGTYVLPTGWADTRLAVYGVGISSNTQLGASVGGLSVVGTGSIFGARLIKPLPGLNNYSHSVTAGLDYKSFNQGVTQQGQDSQASPVNYLAWLIAYDSSWRYPGVTTSLNNSLHFSIQGLANDTQEFERRRYQAKPNFLYLTSELKQLRDLPLGLRLNAKLSGQISSSPLISNEQFAVGGMETVRGYYQTQQLGDDGVNTSLELHSPELAQARWDFAQMLRAYVFFDYAHLWIQQPLASNPSHYDLAATGLGLRWQIYKRVLGELDWAYPLIKQGTVDVGYQRFDFKLAYEF